MQPSSRCTKYILVKTKQTTTPHSNIKATVITISKKLKSIILGFISKREIQKHIHSLSQEVVLYQGRQCESITVKMKAGLLQSNENQQTWPLERQIGPVLWQRHSLNKQKHHLSCWENIPQVNTNTMTHKWKCAHTNRHFQWREIEKCVRKSSNNIWEGAYNLSLIVIKKQQQKNNNKQLNHNKSKYTTFNCLKRNLC